MKFNCTKEGLFFFAVGLVGLSGCEAIVNMGGVIPPNYLQWIRPGADHDIVSLELSVCAREMQANSQAMSGGYETGTAYVDECMLKKGFRFVPQPNGYGNFCWSEIFKNNISCRWARGEYKLPENT